MLRTVRMLAMFMACLLVGCSGSHGPTEPPPGSGHVTIRSQPEAAAVIINGGPLGRYTPAALDTIQGNYTVRLSLLGYADTTFTVTVAASPDTIVANLRALPGTPHSASSWTVPSAPGYVECMSLDAGGRVYAEIGEFGSGLVQIYEPSGTPVSSWTLSHQDDSYSSMVIDPAGNTYFAPYYGGFVKKYDATGTGVGAFGNPTDFPSHVGGLVLSPGGDSLFVASASEVTALRPSDGVVQRYFIVDGGAVGNGPIARDQSGHFYFLPSPGDSVLRTNAVGSREVEWAMPVAVSRITVAPDGTLYLALAAPGSGPTFWNGKGPGRIIHLSASGSILSQWGTEHIVPSAIAVAANGDVFVSDFYRGVYTGNVSGGLYRWSNQ